MNMAGQRSRHKKSEVTIDIEEGILTRFPVKTLVRFRCVCKRWGLLVQNKKFIRKHMAFGRRKYLSFSNTKNKPLSITYQRDINGKPKMTFEEVGLLGGKEYLKGIKVVGQCNGLFCLLLRSSTKRFDMTTQREQGTEPEAQTITTLVVWNPSLRESRIIMPWKTMSFFDVLGFGYDHSNDDYKIIAYQPLSFLWEISSLDTSSKMINFPLDFGIDARCTYLDGNIFWPASRDRWHEFVVCLDYVNVSGFILCFDLVLGTFKELPFPPRGCVNSKAVRRELKVVRGRLCVVDIHRYRAGTRKVVIWGNREHIDDGCIISWNKLFILGTGDLKISKLGGNLYQCLILVNLLSYTEDGKLLFRAGCSRDRHYVELLEYNEEEDTFTSVETDLFIQVTRPDLYEYVETLVTPKLEPYLFNIQY